MSRRRRIAIAAGAVAIAAVAAVVAIAAGRGSDARTGSHRIVVADAACAPAWVAPRAGRVVFSVENTTAAGTYNVALASSDHASVYGEVVRLGPQTTDTMDVVLPPGSYRFECAQFGGATEDSGVGVVEGPRIAAPPPFTPVDSNQLYIATVEYEKTLTPWLAKLQRDTDRLTRAVRAGHLAAARPLWLRAHLDYARLGAAYDTFGPYDDLIDGRPQGLRRGVHDPGFHGFLRLEYGLWHAQREATLVPVAEALDRSVRGLRRAFPRLPMANGDVSLRTHEILENTLQFELTGKTDEGSHTSLDTAWANVQGTTLALDAIAPMLRNGSAPVLAEARRGLARLETLLATYRRRPLQSLSRRQRDRLDSETSGLLEELAPIPDRLELVEHRSTGGRDDVD